MAHPGLPEAVAARSLIASIGSHPVSPETQARSLVFAWLVSLPAEADPGAAAAGLAQHLAAAAEPDNPLLPHLQRLLAAIHTHVRPRSVRGSRTLS